MSRKKVQAESHEVEVLDAPVLEDQSTNGETTPTVRNRRKPGTVDEVRKIARTMSYEDRRAILSLLREDLHDDVAAEEAEAIAIAEAHQQRLSLLTSLKGGI